jgi:hypothetical protein
MLLLARAAYWTNAKNVLKAESIHRMMVIYSELDLGSKTGFLIRWR